MEIVLARAREEGEKVRHFATTQLDLPWMRKKEQRARQGAEKREANESEAWSAMLVHLKKSGTLQAERRGSVALAPVGRS
jgi:hypothetical protein